MRRKSMSITLYEQAKAESEGTAERTFQRPNDTVPQSHEQSSRGRVFLVGAGPGDPELVTLKGLHMLRRAVIIVYDRLICPDLLDEGPYQPERVFIGHVSG